MVPETSVVITSRASAGRILCSRRRCSGFAYLISIGGARDKRPPGLRRVRNRLRLVFEDVATREEGGASPEQIARLIAFARGLDLSRGRVLVHCQAGISRSTAAASIVLAVALGPQGEQEARRRILKVRPEARPNVRMLELADEMLGTALRETWWPEARL